MHTVCKEFRTRWLEYALDAGSSRERAGHLDGCESCQAWVGEAHAQVSAFSQLQRREAPAELDDLVFPITPEEAGTVLAEEPPRWAQAVRELPRVSAPTVLDRLIEEELTNPAAARARRFAGDLPRREAPNALERRVFPILSTRLRSRRGRLVTMIGSAAAAALLIWVGVRGTTSDTPYTPHTNGPYSFKVHEGPPPTIHPMAASLAPGWAAGNPATGEAGR